MTTDSDPVIALSLLCRYRLTQLGSELASRLLLVQSGEQEGAERLAERRVPPPPGAHLASPEPVAATRKRKSRKRSTSAVPESPATVESSLSTYPTSSYRSTITTSPTLSTPSYSRYSSAAPRHTASSNIVTQHLIELQTPFSYPVHIVQERTPVAPCCTSLGTPPLVYLLNILSNVHKMPVPTLT